MMSNFVFLKKNSENLFNIIAEAEKLFRDEYFEQSVIQTRRFAENVCKDLLQDKVQPEETFDSMISQINDQSFGNMRMQEFTNDLYSIKKYGNKSAHSSVATKDGRIALECLERAFEIAIFYSNVKFGYSKKLDKLVFSEEALMTGKNTSTSNFQEQYSQELQQARKRPASIKERKSKSSAQSSNIAPKSSFDSEKFFSNAFSIIFRLSVISLLIFIAVAYVYSHIKALF